jgi:ABC-type lipoprotein release transport system permease subunit
MRYDRFAVRSTTFEVGDRRRCRYNQLPRVAVLPILPGDPLFVPAALSALSVGIVDSFAEQVSGIRYTVPWSTLGVIVGLAYFASLLTTFLPASQASKVYPAEALRYE